jgi:5'(3')-deoxyribonucleotidase
MPITKVFCDIDGVLLDTPRAMLKAHGREDLYDTWPKGEWSAEKVLGLDSSTFWKVIDAAGVDFWRYVPEYPWARLLWETLIESDYEFAFLTSPSWDVTSLVGKKLWLEDVFGRDFRDFIITNKKHLCASPTALLIDDKPANVFNFRSHGHALLFPQPWNEGAEWWTHDSPAKVVERVMSVIKATGHQ